MLSPFPGMDPFLLEDPTGWGDVHSSLIGAIREQLAEAVSPHFFVGVERRVYIVSPDEERPLQTIVPMYQRAHYADGIDYSDFIPLPRLRPSDEAWVKRQVENWQAARES